MAYRLIIYTDGSLYLKAKNEYDGMAGGGAHGYLYDAISDNVIIAASQRPIDTRITIKGYIKNTNLLKPYTNVEPKAYIDSYYYFHSITRIDYIELITTVNALKDVYNKLIPMCSIKSIRVCTDSIFVIKCFEHIRTGKELELKMNNVVWDELDEKGKHYLKNLETVYALIKDKGISVKFRHIKSHDGNIGNQLADRLANYGRLRKFRRYGVKKFHISNTQNYWDFEQDFLLDRYKDLFASRNYKVPDNDIEEDYIVME